MPSSYERFALFEKEDKFYLQPRDNGDNPIGNQCLVLDRVSGAAVISPNRLVLADGLKRENAVYFNLIKSFVAINSFYFSASYDLTHTVQYLQDNGNQEFLAKNMFQRANQDFVWNKYLLADLERINGVSFQFYNSQS
uniref:Phosphatidylinositol-3-phosphatase SAC1 n=1 Tax=Romanomermis culicivorax TaxID=13658 RepID=A0A915J0X3_ROMCU